MSTLADLGLRRGAGRPGAEALVVELVRRGLPLDLLPAAGRVACALEALCHEQRAEALSRSRPSAHEAS
jgi:hypothetical protein